MAFEIEKKYLEVNFDDLLNKLSALNAKSLGIHFESNIVFDFPDYKLHSQNKLIRLRMQEWANKTASVLTFKGPPPQEIDGLKIREEIECKIDNITNIKNIFLAIGLIEIGRYEKIRQSFMFNGAKIELDTVPFGKFVEIETVPENFKSIEMHLGLDKYQISSKSYHELHQQWRVQNRLDPDASFIFPEKIRIKERQRIGLS